MSINDVDSIKLLARMFKIEIFDEIWWFIEESHLFAYGFYPIYDYSYELIICIFHLPPIQYAYISISDMCIKCAIVTVPAYFVYRSRCFARLIFTLRT